MYSGGGSYLQQEKWEKVGIPQPSLGQSQQQAGMKRWLPTALGEVYQGEMSLPYLPSVMA